MMKCRYYLLTVLGLFFFASGNAQILNRSMLALDQEPAPRISGNSVTDIKHNGSSLWIATGSGLSRSDNHGDSWYNFTTEAMLGKGGISALAFAGPTIWVATAFDTLTSDAGSLSAGGGLSYSDDNGVTWHHFPQPGITNVQNVTYDIAILDSTIWITSWGGGLKRSDDWGKTWQDAPPDTFFFNPLDRLNHRAFSTLAVDSILWVGTAAGINRSADNGKTWVNFRHQNQDQPISGNFVVALAHQDWREHHILWAATIEAEDADEYRAVSFSADEGQTWQVTISGEFTHNFAFDDSVVYVATDNGLFKSLDLGKNWDSVSEVRDAHSGESLFTHEFYAADVMPGHELWAGTADGLIRSNDGGSSWQIFRTFETLLDEQNVSATYAYPNPFSPLRHNQQNDEGHVRFHYRVDQSGPVSVSVYDFDMTLVRRVEEGVYRTGAAEYDAIWNGRNDFNEPVANGVYFYRVVTAGSKVVWGKVMVLD